MGYGGWDCPLTFATLKLTSSSLFIFTDKLGPALIGSTELGPRQDQALPACTGRYANRPAPGPFVDPGFEPLKDWELALGA